MYNIINNVYSMQLWLQEAIQDKLLQKLKKETKYVVEEESHLDKKVLVEQDKVAQENLKWLVVA